MRLQELVEQHAPGGTLYHVTTDNRLKSIMATGLEPNRHRRWRNTFGALSGERGYIYLISDFTEAVRFAARQNYYHRLEKKRPKIVMLCCTSPSSLELDDHIDGQIAGNTWYKSTATIPPQNIVRVIPLTDELVQQMVSGDVMRPPEEAEPELAF